MLVVYKTDSLTRSRTALHWFESYMYLVGRRQRVRTPATFSSPTVIEWGGGTRFSDTRYSDSGCRNNGCRNCGMYPSALF